MDVSFDDSVAYLIGEVQDAPELIREAQMLLYLGEGVCGAARNQRWGSGEDSKLALAWGTVQSANWTCRETFRIRSDTYLLFCFLAFLLWGEYLSLLEGIGDGLTYQERERALRLLLSDLASDADPNALSDIIRRADEFLQLPVHDRNDIKTFHFIHGLQDFAAQTCARRLAEERKLMGL
jgi:hypothetical protein